MFLEVANLTKRYGKVTALDQVTFNLSGGGIIGFVGANGAGKTTALRIMSGLEEPDAGDVKLDGVSLIDYPDKMRRRVGFMPDTLPDAADIIVKEYLDFFVNSFIPAESRRETFERITNFTGTDSFLSRRLSDLSKGMKQRVSLARLMIHNPDLLLLDEPAAGLDPRARAELHEMLKFLAGQGKMIFLSSHILAELENMISSVVIIDKGKIVRYGSLDGSAEEQTLEVENVVLGILGEVSETVIKLIAGLPMVRKVKHDLRTLECQVVSAEFAGFITALGQINFPLAWLRRSDRTVELEKLFLEVTAKGDN